MKHGINNNIKDQDKHNNSTIITHMIICHYFYNLE